MMKANRNEPSAAREDRIPMLRLEKYLLNELPPEERARLEEDAARNPRLASSLAEMRESRSALDWQALRGRMEAPAPSLSIFQRLGNRWEAWLPAPGPKLAWAGAFALLLLLAPAALIPFKGDSGFRAKGHSNPEVVLEIGGSRLAPGERQNVQTGDILGFSYRSIKPLYTQIWYREDGGAPSLFDGRSDSSLFWPASAGWTPAPQRIRLEGEWKIQRVIILASPGRIAPEDARRMVLGELKPKKPAGLFTYDLIRP
jgi:hypothetical protein